MREQPAESAAAEAFLERCRLDLSTLFLPRDAVDAIVERTSDDGDVELEAHVVVSGRPGRFAARGETAVEAYGRLRAIAPEERIALAFRALVAEHPGQ